MIRDPYDLAVTSASYATTVMWCEDLKTRLKSTIPFTFKYAPTKFNTTDVWPGPAGGIYPSHQ